MVYHDNFINGNIYRVRYWPFVRGIHRSPVKSHDKGQWRGALMFCLICAWTNGWTNYRDAVDSSRWHHNENNGVSNHQPHNCLFDRLFKPRSKKTSKRRVTGLCEGNSLKTGEFPAQRASTAENVSIWWRRHVETPSRSLWRHCKVLVNRDHRPACPEPTPWVGLWF